MIDFLTLVIVGVALLQPTFDRKMVALAFASMSFIHNTFMATLEGLMYYATDALFYLIVIFVVGLINSKTVLTDEIQKISIVAVALDYFGWLIYMLYIPPTGYNVAFMALYAWTIIILLRREPEDVGTTAMDRWLPSIHSHAHTGHIVDHQYQEAKWHTNN
jgi:hypothetical protein